MPLDKGVFDIDQNQSPAVLKHTNFSYYANRSGETMLVFYKNDVAEDGPKTIIKDNDYPLKDEKHGLQKALIFLVNVYDAAPSATK